MELIDSKDMMAVFNYGVWESRKDCKGLGNM